MVAAAVHASPSRAQARDATGASAGTQDAKRIGMISSRLAIVGATLGLFSGACGSSTLPGTDHRDADVANPASPDAPGGGALDISAADAAAAWTRDEAAASGPDAPASLDALRPGKVACEDKPEDGESCDSMPAGYSCRLGSCAGGCYPECRCTEGRWRCSVVCRDYFSVTPVECGAPPVCRDYCVPVAILPDGGFGPADGPITLGYRYSFYFAPTDMTTLWGDQALMIKIGSGPVLAEASLADLSTRVTLRTWPELETVQASVSVEATLDASVPAQRIAIKPQSKLPDRWYALHVSSLPFWATAEGHVAPDGAYVARFRVGSEPHITTVTFAGGTSKHRLYIGLSESVVASVSPAQLTQVRSLGQVVTCTDVDFAAGRATGMLSFDCPTVIEFPEEISIGTGLVSTTGAVIAPVVVKKAGLTLKSCGTSCEVAGID